MKNIVSIFMESSVMSRSKATIASWPSISIFILIVLSAIAPPGLVTAMNLYLLLLSTMVWIASKKPADNNLFKVIFSFSVIATIGLSMGAGSDSYLYWKDAWYCINPPIIICIGFVLIKSDPDLERNLRAIIYAGLAISIIYLYRVGSNPDLFSESAVSIREASGYGYCAPVLSVILLSAYIGKWKSDLKIDKYIAAIVLFICSLAIILSFSRTLTTIVIIGLISIKGFFAKKEFLRIGIIAAVFLLVILTLRIFIDVDSSEASKSFIGKIARITDELTIQEFNDLASINKNWRGYETARALRYYSSGSPLNLIFGYGFGAQVDLGLFMPLGSGQDGERESIRFAPILHNGYMYVLIKSGALGVLSFLYALINLYKLGKKGSLGLQSDSRTKSSRVLQALVISLAFTTWTVAGVFNKVHLFPLLLLAGMYIAYLSDVDNEHKIHGQ